jgi:hypothetical protein
VGFVFMLRGVGLVPVLTLQTLFLKGFVAVNCCVAGSDSAVFFSMVLV